MKHKLAMLALVGLLSTTASAVTISWNASAQNSCLFGLTSDATMTYGEGSQTASIVMYYFDYADYDAIIALGKVEAADIVDGDGNPYAVATATGNTTDNVKAAGRVKASGKNTDYTTSGNSFFARAYASFDGETYFIDLFGGAGNDGVWTMSQSGDERASEAFAWSAGTYGGSTSTSVGTRNAWVAVPEPSVALMGLLGLGMLLKRRKA